MLETVSNAAIKDLVDTCLGLNEISTPTLLKMGVPLDALNNPQLRSPEKLLINIWQWLDANSKRAGLGLEIGSVINPSAKGLLASWVSQANTLDESLAIFRKNISLMSPSESWEVCREGKHVALKFYLSPNKGYPIMAIERSVAALVTWGRALCGVSFEIERADFSFARPDYSDLYTPLFGHNVNFNSPDNAVFLAAPILDLPVMNGNEFLKGMMAQAADQAQRSMTGITSYKQRVMMEIEKAFDANLDISVESICEVLSLSRQTLFRKLKEEGCDFRSLSDQFKKERALLLLQSARNNITSVGLSLGYKDSSSFTKAFKRWYGLTPKDYLTRRSF